MDRRTRFGSSVAAAALVLLASACSGGDRAPDSTPAAPTSRPAPSASSVDPTTTPLVDPAAVRSAVATLQDFLDEWSAHGAAAASRYLVPADRATSDIGMPRIGSAQVLSHRVTSWHDASRFTFTATMRIRFDGPRSAWDRGPEQFRFVTAHRQVDGSYLLSLATSP